MKKLLCLLAVNIMAMDVTNEESSSSTQQNQTVLAAETGKTDTTEIPENLKRFLKGDINEPQAKKVDEIMRLTLLSMFGSKNK